MSLSILTPIPVTIPMPLPIPASIYIYIKSPLEALALSLRETTGTYHSKMAFISFVIQKADLVHTWGKEKVWMVRYVAVGVSSLSSRTIQSFTSTWRMAQIAKPGPFRGWEKPWPCPFKFLMHIFKKKKIPMCSLKTMFLKYLVLSSVIFKTI